MSQIFVQTIKVVLIQSFLFFLKIFLWTLANVEDMTFSRFSVLGLTLTFVLHLSTLFIFLEHNVQYGVSNKS